jgi:uncharacterized protein
VILVDSNIPMYLVGAPHPLKLDAQRLLERSIADGERLVTDAEVLQEILHRYVAIGRREAIQPAFDALLNVIDEVFPIEPADVDRAKSIVLGSSALSARDAIHLAVMARRRVQRIMSFDTGFDGFPGVARVAS